MPELKDLTTLKLTANTTVNFNSSMTTAQIQTLIDAIPKDLDGKTVTFQFANGTYNLGSNNYIMFSYFYNGNIFIQGNISETNAAVNHTTQSVILSSNLAPINVMNISNCAVTVRNLKITNTTAGWGYPSLYFHRCSGRIVAQYNCVTKPSVAGGGCIEIYDSSNITISNNVTVLGYYGIYAANSFVHTSNNTSSGNASYGICSDLGSRTTILGTTPSGNNAATQAANSGTF